MRKLLPTLLHIKSKFDSSDYWENRYKSGGNSGNGSYNHLAQFKADVINNLIKEFEANSIIEFGCGDGNQLSLLNFNKYIGLDVSVTAIEICKQKYKNDQSKKFFLYNCNAFIDNKEFFRMDGAISIDVLFHLVEKNVYEKYLNHLFACASKLVIVYAANLNIQQKNKHELYRKFTDDIDKRFPEWKLEREIKNRYPAKDYEDENGSLADFFIYTRNK
jgi:SAM-dependent methyltransferase